MIIWIREIFLHITSNILVIDEFDKCLEMGFQDEMSRLIKSLPGLRRHFLLSATEAEEIPQFVHMGRVEKIDYRVDEEQVPDRVHIYKVESQEKDKLESLALLLRSFGRSEHYRVPQLS